MLVLPYDHEEALPHQRGATRVILAGWVLAAMAVALTDAPLEKEARQACEAAAVDLVSHPAEGAPDPGWAGCPLARYAAISEALHGRTAPLVGAGRVGAVVRGRARQARLLAEARLRSRLGHLPDRPTWASPLTSALLFAGPLGLLAGLVTLLVLGPFVEQRRGPWFLIALLAGGGAAGVLALGAWLPVPPATAMPGAPAGLAALLGAALAARPTGRVRVLWAWWWLAGGRLSVPAAAALPAVWLLSLPGGVAGDRPARMLALHLVPLALGTLVELALPMGERASPGQPAKPKTSAAPVPPARLMLRRAGVLGLREDRAILSAGPAVVELLWDDVRFVAPGATADVGPLLDLISSLHDTPSGVTAKGYRVLASETDFGALFRQPEEGGPHGYTLLLEAVASLARGATPLPLPSALAYPPGYRTEAEHDAALLSSLYQAASSDRPSEPGAPAEVARLHPE